jgi:hypothetical protein
MSTSLKPGLPHGNQRISRTPKPWRGNDAVTEKPETVRDNVFDFSERLLASRTTPRDLFWGVAALQNPL